MNKNRWLIGVGLLIVFTPFLGFPLAFKNFLFVVLGLIVVYLGYSLKQQKVKQKFEEDIFVDSKKVESNDFEFPATYNDSEINTQKLLDDQENQ